MRFLLLLAVTALAEPTPPMGKVFSQDTPMMRLSFEDGFVKWVDRRELPNRLFSSFGPMTVDVYEHWVLVKTSAGELHVVPREYVVYIGTWHFDDKEPTQ